MTPMKKTLTINLCTKMIKCSLLAPLILVTLPSHGESFTARSAGQGFTSINADFTSSLSNPALLTKFDEDDDFFFSLNLGLLGSDKYSVLDSIDDVIDDLDDLEDDINNSQYPDVDDLYNQVDDIVYTLGEIDQKVIKIEEGINFQVLIPNQYLSFGLFANQYGRIGGLVDYVEEDEQIMNDAVMSGSFDIADLDSSTLALGYSISEFGIMAAYPVIEDESYDLSIGTKLKYQRIDLIYANPTINEFDDDDFEITDDEYITDSTATNADLGLYASFGDNRQWSVALVANNLMKQTVTHELQNIKFNLETSAIIGLNYQNDWVSVSTELDLMDREEFKVLEASKYARVGAEFRLYEHLQLRAGYRMDLNDVDDDVFTAGIGISPWDVLAIDIAGFVGENDTGGAALQFSLKI
ncbi:conjugal transfer protein TraF [Colwellia sp. E2M01]|uniref:conjugal transfer protein TraF n=1 Tax=Colwellia sp. E2M01 TaxID=2841561 RepID=UPI001C08AD17|nr:conjugal transfer protein TraF [Colwellia sp. E2M01]MBU2870237.1 conjugal transfer protein TraF [Colwellia sp. E2M01]